MTPEQTKLVQDSFAHVVPIADTAATLFYERLFELNPSLRKLFSEHITDQKKKLMTMLATAVANLHQWDKVSPQVKNLGQRHVGYGVTSGDYATVGEALIDTLEKGLGDAFTPPVREAWVAAYTGIAGDMLQGATASEPLRA